MIWDLQIYIQSAPPGGAGREDYSMIDDYCWVNVTKPQTVLVVE